MNLVARFRSCRWSPLTPINSPNLCTNSWRNGHSCWGGGWAESGWVHCAMRLGQKNYGQAMVLAMFDDRVRLRKYWPMETKTNTHGNRPPYDLRLSETMLPDLRVHQCYARNPTEPDVCPEPTPVAQNDSLSQRTLTKPAKGCCRELLGTRNVAFYQANPSLSLLYS